MYSLTVSDSTIDCECHGKRCWYCTGHRAPPSPNKYVNMRMPCACRDVTWRRRVIIHQNDISAILPQLGSITNPSVGQLLPVPSNLRHNSEANLPAKMADKQRHHQPGVIHGHKCHVEYHELGCDYFSQTKLLSRGQTSSAW